jgi:short-subunit dehydrogenase
MNLKHGRALGIGGALLAAAVLRRRSKPADLMGQTVLITGGSRGLGLILARQLACEGCRIVICARDEGELEQARLDLEARGADVLAIPCDVSDQAQVEQMISTATAHFGPIDILINNAGVISVGPLQNTTIADFENALGIMFWGILYPTLAVLPNMLARRRGRIVNITSIGGKVSVPHLLPYASAKFAAVGLSQGLRAELINEGIQVTTIVPGLMRTGSYLHALFRGQQRREFTWFSLGSSLPLISMDAERAARQIIEATKRGEAERVLSVPAQILMRFSALFPGLTATILGGVNALLLPSASRTKTDLRPGLAVQSSLSGPREEVLERLTALGQQAAQRFHQYSK